VLIQFRATLAIACLVLGFFSSAAAAQTTSTLRLDGLSFISFQERQSLPIPSGSSIRMHFSKPAADGAISIAVRVEDVVIPPVPVPGSSQSFSYRLAGPASGRLRVTPDGGELELTALVVVRGSAGGGEARYSVRFTTGTASAANSRGSGSLSVTGVRIPKAARYVQLVGATTNHVESVVEPGSAVYAVLSGSFDSPLPGL